MRNICVYLFLLLSFALSGQNVQSEISFPTDYNNVWSEITIPQAGQRSALDPVLAQKLQDSLDAMLQFYNITGLSAAFITPEGDQWRGASGTNAFPAIPMTTENALGFGSVSKTLTAAAIMRLWDNNQLQLSDPLSMYLPAYNHISGAITIDQCLRHFTGLYDYTGNPALGAIIQNNSSTFISPDEILEDYMLAPVSSPGTVWAYCNTNYLLLGKVIEAVSGQSFHTYIREEFLAPLALDSITLGAYEAETNQRAHIWADPGFGKLDLIFAGFSTTALFSSAWSAGAYWATPGDISRWMRELMQGNVLSEEALNMMKDVHVISSEFAYGAGLIRYRVNGVDAWGHGGNIVFKSVVLHIPEFNVSIAVVSNDNDFIWEGNVVAGLLEVWLGHISSTDQELETMLNVGIYPNPSAGMLWVSNIPTGALVRVVSIDGIEKGLLPSYNHGELVSMEQLFPEIHFQSGYYFLEVIYQDGRASIPFVLRP
jgi:D-alanyl-D-alanine carboxypeptidase